jgi:hypothetical protein
MPIAELIDQFVAGPELLRKSVAGMSHEQARARPIAGKWSTLEVVAHLADFEIVGVDRLAAVIAETEPVLPGRDETKYAARLAYQERDLEEQLRLIELCRSHVARVLRTLNEADLHRRGNHSHAGPLTLEQLLDRTIGHVAHHVKFIHAKRQALGLS